MNIAESKIFERKVVIRLRDRVCETPEELLSSELFSRVLQTMLADLGRRQSLLLDIFPDKTHITKDQIQLLTDTIYYLSKMPLYQLPHLVPGSEQFMHDPLLLEKFLRHLYNYWRSFDRFIICNSDDDTLDKRPYRTFHTSAELLMDLIRGVWRDVYENVSGAHANLFRQVSAGAGVACITATKQLPLPAEYESLNSIPMIRDIMLYPPLVINPPMNKRTGQFEQIDKNPMSLVELKPDEWLCYPARVGNLLINIYFHESFYDLGFTLANLFELADDKTMEGRKPDAIFFYGVQGDVLDGFDKFPTVFYEDQANGMLVGAIPGRPEFGYFGYLKKMALTLHNICMMKQNKMPFHGALFRIVIKGGKQATVLIMGDSGAGKSETLEAFRVLGADDIQDIIVVADDMGSLDMDETGNAIGYGTEVGAFVRLDDLQPGYAFGQMDRIIIMNAGQTNARIVLPITDYKDIVTGYPIDIVLYCNNFEQVDDQNPVIQQFNTVKEAITVFRAGAVMSKGTTTSTGLVHTFYANIFGPAQYPDLYDSLAERYFNAFSAAGLYVGQMRTRLSIHGWEQKGPEAAAHALLEIIRSR
jgi:energy-coupling factor transporter ATP-binding protein EcfA2